MTNQDDIAARKAASAAGASSNSGLGVDGDDPSVADGNDVDAAAGKDAAPDPVTGSSDHAVGQEQAAENEEREADG
jgi:hypothetical protein